MPQAPSVDQLRALLAAFNAHDIEQVMAFFSEDCTLEMPRGPDPWGTRCSGSLAVRAALQSRFDGIPDVRYSDDSHVVVGDLGISQRCIMERDVRLFGKVLSRAVKAVTGLPTPQPLSSREDRCIIVIDHEAAQQ